MLSRTEIAHGVSGAWRLMWGDGGGLYMLDRTREGFWRSFRVALLIAPLQVFCSLIVYQHVDTIASDNLIILTESLSYIIGWTAFPVVLLEIARRAGWSQHYIGAVVAMNWANVPLIVFWTMTVVLGEVVPSWLSSGVEVVLTVLSVFWLTRILRGTLSIGIGQAVALSVLNYWINITLFIVVASAVGRLPATPA
jgi:hypothetical protein